MGTMAYVLVLFLFLPFFTWGSPAEEISEHSIPVLDTIQELLGHRVNHLANDFDSFFATERADDELGRSKIRLGRRYTVQERSLPDDDTLIRFNLRLPSLEKRFKDIVQTRKPKKGESDYERKERSIKYIKATELDTRWMFRSDLAVNASVHPNLTARGRLRKSASTMQLIHRFVQESTWKAVDEGFRQKTTLNTDYTLNRDLLFRFNNVADWKISLKNFTTGHGPNLFHRLTEDDALVYNYSIASTVISGTWYLSNHQVSTTYRRNLYHQFLYLDLGTGLNFPKAYSFRRTPFVFLQIEALFGS